MQCFQKDPNLRISSKKLSKHPWISSRPLETDEDKTSIEEKNEDASVSKDDWDCDFEEDTPPTKPIPELDLQETDGVDYSNAFCGDLSTEISTVKLDKNADTLDEEIFFDDADFKEDKNSDILKQIESLHSLLSETANLDEKDAADALSKLVLLF